jgi:hypothetical protein
VELQENIIVHSSILSLRYDLRSQMERSTLDQSVVSHLPNSPEVAGQAERQN